MEDNESLTSKVIGAAIEVHRHMGPGLLESVYQACMAEELRLQGMECKLQHRLPLVYKETILPADLILDIYFPNQLVVELKAVDRLAPVHEAQLLTYLKLSRTRLGLLINFNVPVLKDGLKRMIL